MESIKPPPWGPPSAYLYTLKLDDRARAWEYLRRNASYRADFVCAMHHPTRDSLATRWGLRRWEDPRGDSRVVEPAWLGVANSEIVIVPTDAQTKGSPFDFWRIPNRKGLHHDGEYLRLTVTRGSEVLNRLMWPESLNQNELFAISVAPDRGFIGRVRAAQGFLRSRDCDRRDARSERPSTHDLLHMQMLQALDGVTAEASQRDIARRLFCRSTDGWEADGCWRARVRYLIKSGHARCTHGYRRMVGLGTKGGDSVAIRQPVALWARVDATHRTIVDPPQRGAIAPCSGTGAVA